MKKPAEAGWFGSRILVPGWGEEGQNLSTSGLPLSADSVRSMHCLACAAMNRKLVWGGYVLALHVALVLAVHRDFRPTPEKKRDIFIAWMLGMQELAEPSIPPGSIVMLGDSITQAMPPLIPHAVNFGIGGLRSDQLLSSLPRYRSLARASVLVLTIGTNDLLQNRDEGIAERYRAILSALPPVPVVMSSVPPNRNVRVADAVHSARTACSQRPGCVFVDASTLPDTAVMSDGTHLSTSGYAAWTAMLLQAIHVASRQQNA